MCPTSTTQRRLNKEYQESKAKPGGSIQKPRTSRAKPDLSGPAKHKEQQMAERTEHGQHMEHGQHKGEPVKNPKVQLPGG